MLQPAYGSISSFSLSSYNHHMPDQLAIDDLKAFEPASDPLDALTVAQRDRLVIRLVATLFVGLVGCIAALILASVLGLVRPNCDGLPLNNRVGQCYHDVIEPTLPAPTVDPARYHLRSLDIAK